MKKILIRMGVLTGFVSFSMVYCLGTTWLLNYLKDFPILLIPFGIISIVVFITIVTADWLSDWLNKIM